MYKIKIELIPFFITQFDCNKQVIAGFDKVFYRSYQLFMLILKIYDLFIGLLESYI